MATYPYNSSQTAVQKVFAQLRKGFPEKLDAGYLQRFNIAPANESYIIGILRFLGLIDEDGKRSEGNVDYFYADDKVFQEGLERTLRSGYVQLFDEMGEEALSAEKGRLQSWFRAADKTSQLVGDRQATTFQTLAALAGHGELPVSRGPGARKTTRPRGSDSKGKSQSAKVSPKTGGQTVRMESSAGGGVGASVSGVGLTVRIEVNLPTGADPDTYDSIFASIKKHLIS